MLKYAKHIDWKLVFFSILAGYVAPAFLVNPLLGLAYDAVGRSQDGQSIFSLVITVMMILPPVAAGYFSARFARTLPRLQVLVVGVVGAGLSLVFFRSSLLVMAGYAIGCLALTCLGGFMRLRTLGRGEA
jgi:ABC-type molybdate transport system permease subunit